MSLMPFLKPLIHWCQTGTHHAPQGFGCGDATGLGAVPGQSSPRTTIVFRLVPPIGQFLMSKLTVSGRNVASQKLRKSLISGCCSTFNPVNLTRSDSAVFFTLVVFGASAGGNLKTKMAWRRSLRSPDPVFESRALKRCSSCARSSKS